MNRHRVLQSQNLNLLNSNLLKSSQRIPQFNQSLTYNQQRPLYGLLYKIFVKKDPELVNNPNQSKEDQSIDPDIRAARDKYVQEQTKELLFSMKATETPKGVKFSFFMLSFPLICTTTYLIGMSPLVGVVGSNIDPVQFAYLARSCVRLLALNISFIGGIHYGLASASYETAVTDEELRRVQYQMIYSFIPAAMSFSTSSFLLFASPLTLQTAIFAFTGLMITQLITLQVDLRCVEKELAPKWFLRFRSVTFALYMILTSAIFFVYYAKLDYVQRRNDKNRIKTIKSAMELEDLDFIEMVNEMKIDYDEGDLKEIEKEVTSNLQRLQRKQEFMNDVRGISESDSARK